MLRGMGKLMLWRLAKRREGVAAATLGLSLLIAVSLPGCTSSPSKTTEAVVASEVAVPESSSGVGSTYAGSSEPTSTPGSVEPIAPSTIEPTSDGQGVTIAVPRDAPTIQAGVDKAKPGDLVLISPGTYHEAVFVRTERVVVRGTDRNTVILDGKDALENGITASANGVAIENLTVHNYLVNGIVFTKKYDDNADSLNAEDIVLKGYRASYITAFNNGLYGLYAFYARDGQMDNSYVSGNPDGGIYIGQCKPCNVVITNIVGERNAIGFLGTNASGNLSVINSVWRNNKIGLLPQSEDSEQLAPQQDVLLAGNLVEDNNGGEAPAYKSWGYGIVVGGGQQNRILKNRVRGHKAAGIFITELAQYLPLRNTVSENTLSANGVDLAYAPSTPKSEPWAGGGNCFVKNRFESSVPTSIEVALPCDGKEHSVETSPPSLQSPPGNVDYRVVTKPVAQPTMANPLTEDALPAVGLPVVVDLAAIFLPQ
jgi:Right handed beta helix region